MKVLVTGIAGFIGFSVARRLAKDGHQIFGVDNLNAYYSPDLKRARLAELEGSITASVVADIADYEDVERLIAREQFDVIVHLAAQAGVRYSITNPHSYVHSNVLGTLNIFEASRRANVEHVLYASSSSVYGLQKTTPYSIEMKIDKPVSLYAATKASCELIAESYSHVHGLRCTGLRFFTVYGPWGRPDMAYYKFTKSILAGEPIEVYNNGDMSRDFTYIDDIVEGVVSAMVSEPSPKKSHKIYNLGNSRPERLETLIAALERSLGRRAERRYLPMQPGDVYQTYADISESTRDLGYMPRVELNDGLQRFVDWYKSFHTK